MLAFYNPERVVQKACLAGCENKARKTTWTKQDPVQTKEPALLGFYIQFVCNLSGPIRVHLPSLSIVEGLFYLVRIHSRKIHLYFAWLIYQKKIKLSNLVFLGFNNCTNIRYVPTFNQLKPPGITTQSPCLIRKLFNGKGLKILDKVIANVGKTNI